MISGVKIEPLRIIPGESGTVFHAMKNSDPSFESFGEAYFSSVEYGSVKGWKKHREMTLNIVVPCGAIRFVLYDDRNASPTKNQHLEITLSPENYSRLTVPPKVWMAFQGVSERSVNLLLNIASIPHDPEESENAPLADPRFPRIT
ncbi:MAG: dTDP-4-dehydrorhamnose 3,5-epimerase family protein [Verrucomicrobiota bacterium]